MAKLSASRQRALFRKYARNVKYLMILASVALIVYSLPKQAKFSYEIDKGRIWNQKDLVSPYNFAILKTQPEIDEDRKNALASVTPIYQLDTTLADQQLQGFKNDFEIKWHGAGFNDSQKPKYLAEGIKLLTAVYEKGVLSLNKKYQQNGENYPITILNNNIAADRNTIDLYTRERALAWCDNQLTTYRKDLNKAFI